ncbi:patatin-like phospholipase family protein [Bdellovibrio sp. 22V]|uniref:patatin-like phospholipase family protein n=1 Tax=Bdellovibrio TaxID=958 RepID=UPI002543944B|nr:patatin-like phospholipase family protein [Bdellovibrio sp. 22V]WII71028.1 patatin-like phospholipase family protein [Bdellovibrio sp. 22V]
MSVGLVLSGGGARGAYQAGVLSAIAEISKGHGISQPFNYYTGISAGALNATFLAAAENNDIVAGCNKLLDLWSHVESQQVYISDPVSLSFGGLRWLTDLSFGAMKPTSPRKSLLDTSPLRKLVYENCRFENIQKNIDKGHFRALAVSALDYMSTSTVTFIQGPDDIPLWRRVRKQAERSTITADHVLASSAIPLLFPPVAVDHRHFGDGCIRNQSPCGPAIYMGARKLLAIGVRRRQDVCYSAHPPTESKPPSVGRVVNVLLHTLMMDGLEIDIERIDRINANIAKLTQLEQAAVDVRPIDYLWISPSIDVAEIAANKVEKLPRMIRYLLKGLGTLQDASEVASFLLFEPEYCQHLIKIGYADGMKHKEEILHLLSS